jgi:hypothetical protein
MHAVRGAHAHHQHIMHQRQRRLYARLLVGQTLSFVRVYDGHEPNIFFEHCNEIRFSASHESRQMLPVHITVGDSGRCASVHCLYTFIETFGTLRFGVAGFYRRRLAGWKFVQ